MPAREISPRRRTVRMMVFVRASPIIRDGLVCGSEETSCFRSSGGGRSPLSRTSPKPAGEGQCLTFVDSSCMLEVPHRKSLHNCVSCSCSTPFITSLFDGFFLRFCSTPFSYVVHEERNRSHGHHSSREQPRLGGGPRQQCHDQPCRYPRHNAPGR